MGNHSRKKVYLEKSAEVIVGRDTEGPNNLKTTRVLTIVDE